MVGDQSRISAGMYWDDEGNEREKKGEGDIHQG